MWTNCDVMVKVHFCLFRHLRLFIITQKSNRVVMCDILSGHIFICFINYQLFTLFIIFVSRFNQFLNQEITSYQNKSHIVIRLKCVFISIYFLITM